ncbi:hypothetical protein CSQ87_03670 [Bifidobacterium simiarum]|uniref:Uncharacterized protein n=1 Tax=Bifidobacterium simiarum TaxID=2045441 RepID=A0A2M9HFE5_9BIFI|nr:hypothetical protein CSQ87_03670 [Bifidobacterium simiarum]
MQYNGMRYLSPELLNELTITSHQNRSHDARPVTDLMASTKYDTVFVIEGRNVLLPYKTSDHDIYEIIEESLHERLCGFVIPSV